MAAKGKETAGQQDLLAAYDLIDHLTSQIDALSSDLAETKELLHTAQEVRGYVC